MVRSELSRGREREEKEKIVQMREDPYRLPPDSVLRTEQWGQPLWCSGLAPPAAWGVILETPDQVPHQVPCMEPASPSACDSASLCVSINK